MIAHVESWTMVGINDSSEAVAECMHNMLRASVRCSDQLSHSLIHL